MKRERRGLLATLRAEWLAVAVAALYVAAALDDPAKALRALAVGASSLWSVALIVVSVFGLIGLFGVFVDKQAIAARLGAGSGFVALLLAAAFGTILVGPVFAVFPLLKVMREHGTRWAVIATTLTAWAVKVPMLPLEIGFLGWRFSAARIALTLVASLAMGLIVERLMGERGMPAEELSAEPARRSA